MPLEVAVFIVLMGVLALYLAWPLIVWSPIVRLILWLTFGDFDGVLVAWLHTSRLAYTYIPVLYSFKKQPTSYFNSKFYDVLPVGRLSLQFALAILVGFAKYPSYHRGKPALVIRLNRYPIIDEPTGLKVIKVTIEDALPFKFAFELAVPKVPLGRIPITL